MGNETLSKVSSIVYYLSYFECPHNGKLFNRFLVHIKCLGTKKAQLL